MSQKSMFFDVTRPDGSVERVVAGPADYIALERRFNVALQVLGDPERMRVEYLVFLAWRGLRRGRPEIPDFDKWVEDEMVELPAVVEVGKDPVQSS